MNEEEEYAKRYRDYHKKRHREMAVWAVIALVVGGALTVAAFLLDDLPKFGAPAMIAFFTAFIIGIPLLIELYSERWNN